MYLDLWDRLDILNEALGSINSARDNLRDSSADDDILDILDNAEIIIQHRYDDVHKKIEEIDARETEALTREYYRGLL